MTYPELVLLCCVLSAPRWRVQMWLASQFLDASGPMVFLPLTSEERDRLTTTIADVMDMVAEIRVGMVIA